MRLIPIDLKLSPLEAASCWPDHVPLVSLWSNGNLPDSRWTILARPGDSVFFQSLPDLLRLYQIQPPSNSDEPPFVGGWIGVLSYDLGGLLEPRSRGRRTPVNDSDWPLAVWQRVDDALLFDHAAGRWHMIGNPPELRFNSPGTNVERFRIGSLTSGTGRDAFLTSVARSLEYIRAGDVYQVNLAHRLSGDFEGSARALFIEMMRTSKPRHGAFLEWCSNGQQRAIVSASPELFLTFDPTTRRVVTRPMKGTRALSLRDAQRQLHESDKDRAELNMIIDLMRNDLGRVCEIGSVRVDEERVLEQHGTDDGRNNTTGVLQATATISGFLRGHLTINDLLAASFPGGSVTGAPKIRAMQIIHELEPCPRGPYCGSIGFVSDNGHAAFNIAIRTALISGDHIHYSVGAGIVADSVPESEWDETIVKAESMLRVAGMAAGQIFG